MIYTVLADISKFDKDPALLPLRSEVLEHIISAKDKKVRHERAGAYLILSILTKKMFGKNPVMIWSNNGKPEYKDEKIYFNISHSGEMVAVGISDTSYLGVDIEQEVESERAKRLESRFFSGLTFADSPLDVNYIYGELSSDGELSLYDFFKKDNAEYLVSEDKGLKLYNVRSSDSFSVRWTLYEATLKSGGGGFVSLPCLDMMLLETRADMKKIYNMEKAYYISVVAKK